METTEFWGGYFKLAAPLLAGYYLFVAYKFYRHELMAWAGSRKGTQSLDAAILQEAESDLPEGGRSSTSGHQAPETEEEPEPWQNEETFQKVEDLAAYLKEAIAEAHQKQYDKQELVLLIRMTLEGYGYLAGTPFRYAINNLIENECAKYGRIHPGADDLAEVWKVG